MYIKKKKLNQTSLIKSYKFRIYIKIVIKIYNMIKPALTSCNVLQ